MTRNTSQRVEVATPVYDYKAKMQLNKILKLSLQDNQKSRIMVSDGNYTKVTASAKSTPHNSQIELFEDAYKRNEKAPKSTSKKKTN